MPRLPRIDVVGLPQHIVVRGNNRQRCFLVDADRWVFMKHLVDSARVRDCELHAYVLMPNHAHLLLTGGYWGAASDLMQDTGRKFVRFFNGYHQRTGSLFEGRFRSSLVDSDRYLLACMRYIEMNPVRAGLVHDPADYRWSSCRDNLSGAPPAPLTAHPNFLALGTDAASRASAYRALFETPLESRELDAIRKSVAMNRVLGEESFIAELGERLKRNAGVVTQGRPKKGTGQKVP